MLSFLLILSFLFLLAFPDIAFQGASTGITLWFQTVFPTLFPFFIINALLLRTGTIYKFSHILSPAFAPFFGISGCSSYAVLCGFFCGTPVGAKVIVDLTAEKQISKAEGEYLLSFCNNTSPGFLIGFIFDRSLGMPYLAYISLGILFLSAILSSFLFRTMYDSDFVPQKHSPAYSGNSSLHFTTGLDESIWESMETILKIGGYIILFCVLLFSLKTLPIKHFVWNSIFLPFLELTNGVRMITSQALDLSVKYVLLMALASFGGVCAAFQTKCIIHKAGFSFFRYIKEKLITAMVTSLLSLIFIFFYYKL